MKSAICWVGTDMLGCTTVDLVVVVTLERRVDPDSGHRRRRIRRREYCFFRLCNRSALVRQHRYSDLSLGLLLSGKHHVGGKSEHSQYCNNFLDHTTSPYVVDGVRKTNDG